MTSCNELIIITIIDPAAGNGELPITWHWLGPHVVYYKLGAVPSCEHLLRVAAPVLCSLQLHCLSGGGTLVI